jgi:hypothetical protein
MLVFVALSAARAQAPAPPALAPCTVLHPTFTIDEKNASFGTMFAVKVADKTVLVTAHGHFSATGGLPAQIPAADIPKKITTLSARDAFAPTVTCARSQKALLVADAAPVGGAVEGGRDVAAFLALTVADAGLNGLQATQPVPLATLALAAKPPKVGDTVWLAAALEGQPGTLWPAKVGQITEESLFFEYENRTLVLNGTTGAPVLDATGAVVGMNVGSGKMQDGTLFGSAAPASALKKRLETAAAAK